MTKRIYILRHAQSVGKQAGQSDFDRTLTDEGKAFADATGRHLAASKVNVDLIVASAAVRAEETTRCINRSLGIPGEKIILKTELYEALMLHWMSIVHQLPDEVNSVLLVGHNPWLSLLAGEFEGATRDLSPCEIIGFEFDIPAWKDVEGKGKLILSYKPAATL